MTHWSVFTLRGLVAFLSFMNVGTAIRCFIDDGFMRTKFFRGSNANTDMDFQKGGLGLDRLFGFWSIANAVIYLHSAVFLEHKQILSLTVCSLVVYLGYFLVEAYIYKTLALNGAALFPVTVSVMVLIWFIVSYRHFDQREMEEVDENEILLRKVPRKWERKIK